ncbi:MAG: O-antigen ligase family protein [Bdellovibrionota bacterium]
MENRRLRFLAWFLLALPFLAKISLSWTGLVPDRLGYLIYQGGLHPYINVLLCLLAGVPLIIGIYPDLLAHFHPAYRTFIVGITIILGIQSTLQIIIDPAIPAIETIGVLGLTYYLFLLYGIVLPLVIGLDEALDKIARICLWIIVISIGLKIIGSPFVYKGNRFIGIFKHIPHMVTCATVGFIFYLNSWKNLKSFFSKISFVLALSFCMAAVILTGTRSALFACTVATLLFFVCYKSKNAKFQLGRILVFWVMLLALLLFGVQGYNYGKSLVTGEIALGEREAQNGLADRWDEILRGMESFSESPHIGLGLLSKFGNSDGAEVVDSYNSFQDPHNLLISAAVVGGWPLAIWIAFGMVLLTIQSIRTTYQGIPPTLTLGVYLLSHLPILMIYHIHLSIGGMADRLYWLAFAYLALKMAPTKNNL